MPKGFKWNDSLMLADGMVLCAAKQSTSDSYLVLIRLTGETYTPWVIWRCDKDGKNRHLGDYCTDFTEAVEIFNGRH